MSKSIPYLFLLLLLQIVPFITVSSQVKDSLQKLISSASGLEKAVLLNKLAAEFEEEGNSVECSSVAKDALSIALKHQSSEQQGTAYLNLGMAAQLDHDYQLSVEYFEKSLDLRKKSNDNEGLAEAMYQAGSSLRKLGEYNRSVEYYDSCLTIRLEAEDQEGASQTLNSLGMVYFDKGELYKAKDYFHRSLIIKEQLSDQIGIGKSLHNLGNVYRQLGQFDNSISSYKKALTIFEDIDYNKGIASCLGHIAYIYEEQKQYDAAIEFYNKSLELEVASDNVFGIANCKNNLGIVYSRIKEYDVALNYYTEALEIRKEISDKPGIASSYNNIGTVYMDLNKYDLSLEYFQQALAISQESDSKFEIVYNLYSIGLNYKQLLSYQESLSYFEESLNKAQELNLTEYIRDSYKEFSDIYDSIDKPRLALDYHRKYKVLYDSVFSERSDKMVRNLLSHLESTMKEQEIIMLNKDKKIQESEIRKQRYLIYSFVAGFVIILIFSMIVYRLYTQKKKANILLAHQNAEINRQKEEILTQRDKIEAQKELVTKQRDEIVIIHKEITDSIHYAKRIQTAVIISEDEINRILPEWMVLFKPRDIVSGDFYYINKINDSIIVCAADCTGHGVPGAFMSMMGVAFLGEIVVQEEIVTASQVLDELRKKIIEALHQQASRITKDELMADRNSEMMSHRPPEVKDGMDISFCIINPETREMQFAGANNPVYIISNQDENTELVEIKGDKMPIGVHGGEEKSFTNHCVQLYKGDTFYLFSDGYPDQFGGIDNESRLTGGKKFKYKPFKNLLLSIQKQLMKEQKEVLDLKINEWKGELEQVDDIVIVGVRIW